jgi:hypothetical protein
LAWTSIPTSHSTSAVFSTEIVQWSKCYQEEFSSQCLSGNHMVSICMNICTMLPHTFNFNHVFCENYVLVEILSKSMFVWILNMG